MGRQFLTGEAPGKSTEPVLLPKFLSLKHQNGSGFAATVGFGSFACLLFAHRISSCSCVYLHFAGFNWDG